MCRSHFLSMGQFFESRKPLIAAIAA